jgi:hypothetical protein
MATLANFDLLRLSHTDIRILPWTQPVACQAMSLYFGIKRVKEEIVRLNVEIRRTITYMVDESAHWTSVISAVRDLNPVLSAYLSRKADHNTLIFQDIAYHLLKTSKLLAFSGTLEVGTSLDKPLPTINPSDTNLRWLSVLNGSDHVEVKEETIDGTSELQNDLMVDLVEKFGSLE